MNIFEYDSKFMTFLRMTGDLIILNALFLICSIPLFTIGAAQAGLYTGLRELFDRDGDNSSFKSFFRGFKNGFSIITAIWSFVLISLSLLSYSIYYLFFAMKDKIVTAKAPIIVAIAGVVILCAFSAQLTLFHSKFDCKISLLIRNTIIMVIGFPLKSLIMAIMIYLPIIVIIIDGGRSFIIATPLWVFVYYSLVFLLNSSLMKKPFEKMKINSSEESADTDQEEEN